MLSIELQTPKIKKKNHIKIKEKKPMKKKTWNQLSEEI